MSTLMAPVTPARPRLTPAQLRPSLDLVRSTQDSPAPPPAGTITRTRTIDDVLADARAGLSRLTPAEALDAWRDGAVVVDIRPAAQRQAEGELPGALVIERNVLEWRFDPASDAALPIADHDLQVIVLCQEGYTSSLAAAALQELGIWRATDVVGGYAAWRTGAVRRWAELLLACPDLRVEDVLTR